MSQRFRATQRLYRLFSDFAVVYSRSLVLEFIHTVDARYCGRAFADIRMGHTLYQSPIDVWPSSRTQKSSVDSCGPLFFGQSRFQRI